MTIWTVILLLALSAGCTLAARTLIHFFQLESYQFQGYFRTLKRNLLRAILPGAILNLVFWAAGVLLVLLIPEDNTWLPGLLLSLILIGTGWLLHQRGKKQKAKKAMVVTARVKRLYLCLFAVILILLWILVRLAEADPVLFGLPTGRVFMALVLIFPFLLPLWTALGGLAAWPIEKGISGMYFRDARKRLLERPDLIKIGITGSWGKTSVKFILGTLLQEKYNTLVTPGSFNTPMGVTKVIRNDLQPAHRVFVAEMGARHVGEISELCRLVGPEIGILTSVGPQHLDTFRTQERVTRTKYELMEAIPEDGLCCFADDGGICRGLYERTGKPKLIAGLDPEKDDVWAENLKPGPEGSRFDLMLDGERIPCRTRLLGELNIKNIVLCAAVCSRMGLTKEQIRRGIEKLQPVAHRLELIRHPGNYTVIDDAFNSNIVGAEQAFQTLKGFPGRRIVVTPGMVELGDREAAMNRQFGEKMADCCDLAILVGIRRAENIREGLNAAGFPADRVVTVSNLQEAQRWIAANAGPEDVILFENDLPDNYEG